MVADNFLCPSRHRDTWIFKPKNGQHSAEYDTVSISQSRIFILRRHWTYFVVVAVLGFNLAVKKCAKPSPYI